MNWDDPKLAAKYANSFVSSINNYIRDDEILEGREEHRLFKKRD